MTARRINRIPTEMTEYIVVGEPRQAWSAGWAHLCYLILFLAVLVGVVLAVTR